MLIRFDDISDNVDFAKLQSMVDIVMGIDGSKVMFCISPFCSSDAIDGWVFPKRLMTVSDVSEFFKMDRVSSRAVDFCKHSANGSGRVSLAGHGLVHVDHRLLCYQAQEISVCMSSSIIGASAFVPPFHKWNADTEEICRKHGFRLIKFEDGWRHMLYNKHNPSFMNYYVHVCDMTVDEFKEWFT